MGRVDEAPARVDRGVLEEPGDGAAPRPGEAILDLLHLLGDMDVHRTVRDRGEDRRAARRA